MRRSSILALVPGIIALASCPLALAADAAAPAEGAGKIGKLPHLTFDATAKQVRADCEALNIDAPLEFFLVLAGTAEHEAVLRTSAKPSHIHAALLACGLKPGSPLTFVEATEKWI